VNGEIVHAFDPLNVAALLVEQVVGDFVGNAYLQGAGFFLGRVRFNLPEGA
jgi:hypothetical protein